MIFALFIEVRTLWSARVQRTLEGPKSERRTPQLLCRSKKEGGFRPLKPSFFMKMSVSAIFLDTKAVKLCWNMSNLPMNNFRMFKTSQIRYICITAIIFCINQMNRIFYDKIFIISHTIAHSTYSAKSVGIYLFFKHSI